MAAHDLPPARPWQGVPGVRVDVRDLRRHESHRRLFANWFHNGKRRLPMVRPNLTGGPERKPPVQIFDQAIDNLSILLFDAQQGPEAGRAFDVAVAFSDGDRLLAFVDPVVTNTAALGEQAQKVVSLAVISYLRCGGGVAETARRPVHRPRADRWAMGCTRPPIRRNDRPVRNDDVRPTTLFRQTGEIHFDHSPLGFGIRGG